MADPDVNVDKVNSQTTPSTTVTTSFRF